MAEEKKPTGQEKKEESSKAAGTAKEYNKSCIHKESNKNGNCKSTG